MHAIEELPVREGDVLAGRYRVGRILGVGGMGAVVEARHLALDQRVAIKIVLPALARRRDLVERFLREAKLATQLRSEHTVRVLDMGRVEDSILYLVMELLEGVDLAALLRARGPLPPEEAVEYALQTCEALAEAHARGLVHRDIKPGNLFVTRTLDHSPLVKVLDFGIAKELDGAGEGLAGQALTRSSALLGSPLYMSPEQMRSARDVDARSDIWSLGAVLYELLTGKVPFEAQSFGELCMHVVQRSAAPLVEHRADLPPELGAVVLRCLEKEPGARYQDVAQLAAALSPFAPARARPLAARVAAISAAIAAPPSSGRQVGAASDAGAAIGPAPSASGATPPGSGRIPVDTHGSWGATGPGAAPRSRRRWAGALAAALAALALGGFLLQRAMSPGAASTKAATLLAGVGLAIAPAAGAVAQSAERDLLVVPAGGAPPPTGAQPAAQPGGEGSAKAAAPRPAPSPGGASKRPSNARPGTAAPRAAQVPDFGGRK